MSNYMDIIRMLLEQQLEQQERIIEEIRAREERLKKQKEEENYEQ